MPGLIPVFSWDKHFWAAKIALPSWKGEVQLTFAPEGRGDEPLNPVELAFVLWVIKNEAAVSTSLVSSVLNEYPILQDQYGYRAEERARLMPDIKSVDDLRNL